MKKEDYRTIKKNVWMNEKEDAELKKKASAASMSEAHLIRVLISGYHPPAAPGKEFHDDMNKLLKAAEAIERVHKSCRDEELKRKLDEQIAGIEILREALLDKYLLGERKEFKWP